MYSIPDLETFLTVAQLGGITPAAARQGISAATVSHRVAKLEAALKVKLFHRSSRNVSLTEEGQLFRDRVERILNDLYQAEVEAGGGTETVRGHLRVTMSPWILARFILPHLAHFRDRYPDLTVEFLTVDRMVSLVDEGQDCAIRVGQLEDSALVARKICENDRIICAAPGFLERAGVPASVASLRDFDWVCLPWQMQLSVESAAGKAQRLSLDRNILVSSSDMLTEAAIAGLGLVVKSRLAVRDELAAGQLVEVLPGALAQRDAPIWFVAPPGARVSRKTRLFGDLATRAFRHVIEHRL